MFGLWRHQHLKTLTWIAQDVHAKRNHVGRKHCGDIKKSRLFEHAGACHRQFVPASRGTLWNVCVLVKAWPQWVQTHREHVLTTYGADCTTDPCTAFKKYDDYKIKKLGYSIIKKNNTIITDIDKLNKNDNIEIDMYNGYVNAKIKGLNKHEK